MKYTQINLWDIRSTEVNIESMNSNTPGKIVIGSVNEGVEELSYLYFRTVQDIEELKKLCKTAKKLLRGKK